MGMVVFFSAGVVMSADEAENKNIDRYLKRGISRVDRQDYDGALADFSKVIELDPQNSEAYRQRAYLYQNQSKYAEANADYDKALELAPGSGEVLSDRGYCRYLQANYTDALQDLNQAVEKLPEVANVWNRRGIIYSSLGNEEMALENYTKAIELAPQGAVYYANRSDAYSNLGRFRECLGDRDKAVELLPTSSVYWNNRGLIKTYLNDLEGAIADFSEAIKVQPTMAVAFQNRAVAYLFSGKSAESDQDFAQYVALAPGNETAVKDYKELLVPIFTNRAAPKTANEFYLRANDLYNARYHWQALADYFQAITLDDFNPDYFYWYAMTLKQRGTYESAVTAFKKCLDVDDRYALAYYQTGELIRYELKRPKDSISFFKKELELKPNDVDTLASLALAYRDTGELANAVDAFDQCLKADPKYAFGWAYRGDTLRRQGNLDEALSNLNQAVELDGNSWSYHQLRGRLFTARQEYDRALDDLNTSLMILETAYTHMYRGIVYLKTGKKDEAQADFDAALKLYPAIQADLDAEIAEATKSS